MANAFRNAYFKSRAGRGPPSRAKAADMWKKISGGAKVVLWGDESCLEILGKHFNVVWLVAALMPEGNYTFWARNYVDAAGMDDARVAMINTDGTHYEPVWCTYRNGERSETRGSFRLDAVPQVVRETWGGGVPQPRPARETSGSVVP